MLRSISGLDVYQASISAAVLDASGRLVMESVIETKAVTILDFIGGLRLGHCDTRTDDAVA
jgi:hypothetical protein